MITDETTLIDREAVGVSDFEGQLRAEFGLLGLFHRDEESAVIGPQDRSAFGVDLNVGKGATSAAGVLALEAGVLDVHRKANHLKLVPGIGGQLDVERRPRKWFEGPGNPGFERRQGFLPGPDLRIVQCVFFALVQLGGAAPVVTGQGELLDCNGVWIADVEMNGVTTLCQVQIHSLHADEEGPVIGEQGGMTLQIWTQVDHVVGRPFHRDDLTERSLEIGDSLIEGASIRGNADTGFGGNDACFEFLDLIAGVRPDSPELCLETVDTLLKVLVAACQRTRHEEKGERSLEGGNHRGGK